MWWDEKLWSVMLIWMNPSSESFRTEMLFDMQLSSFCFFVFLHPSLTLGLRVCWDVLERQRRGVWAVRTETEGEEDRDKGPSRKTWASVSQSARTRRPRWVARVETKMAAPSPTTRKVGEGATRKKPVAHAANPPASSPMAPRHWRSRWRPRSSLQWWVSCAKMSAWTRTACRCVVSTNCFAATRMSMRMLS